MPLSHLQKREDTTERLTRLVLFREPLILYRLSEITTPRGQTIFGMSWASQGRVLNFEEKMLESSQSIRASLHRLMKARTAPIEQLNASLAWSFDPVRRATGGDRLCVFDLDGTLVGINTTYSFLSFVLYRESILKYSVFQIVRYPAMVLSKLVGKVLEHHRDVYREMMTAFFRGVSSDCLRVYGDEYTLSLMNEMQSPGRKVLFEFLTRLSTESSIAIITNTIVPLDELSKQLGVKVISSKLGFDSDGKLNGKVLGVMKDHAIEILVKSTGMTPWIVVSDDIRDLNPVFPIRLRIINGQIGFRTNLVGFQLVSQ